MSKRMTLAVLACIALSGCSSDSKDNSPKSVTPVEPVTEKKFTLTIKVGEGVSANPGPGSSKYPNGQVVQYSFAPKDGYRNLVVEDSASLLPSSGSVTMNSDHKISAVAEAIPPLMPEAAPVETSAKELFTSKDSVEAVKSYNENLSMVKDVYSTHDLSKAREIIRSAFQRAYEETSDADLDKSNKLLGGNLFKDDVGSLFAHSVDRRFLRSSNASSASTAMIYVNGILNNMDAPAQALAEFGNILSKIGLRGDVDLYNFYNPSSAYTNNTEIRCVLRAVQTFGYKKWRDCQNILANVDLAQAKRQIAEILGTSHVETEPESKTLAKIIRQERAAGRRVILIGHSQGNLVIRQALEEYDQCVAVISLAGPLGKSSWVPWSEPNLDGFVVEGSIIKDLIKVLGYNDFQTIRTNISDIMDQKFRAIEDSPYDPYEIFTALTYDVDLHSLLGSYLAGNESRELVGQMMKDQYEMLAKRSDCARQKGDRIYATSGVGLMSGPSNLWIVPPYSYGVDTLVARIEDRYGEALTLTDLAISPTKEIWGVSPNYLYKLRADSGVILAEEIINFLTIAPNAAAFSPTGDMYVAESSSGEIIGFNPYTLYVFWRGNFGSGLASAGDLAFAPDGRLFAVVENKEGKNYLATVDYLHDGTATPVSEKDLGDEKVYGLAFIGQNLFGITANQNGVGSLVQINTSTGEKTFIRKLGFNAFGAASNRIKKHQTSIDPPRRHSVSTGFFNTRGLTNLTKLNHSSRNDSGSSRRITRTRKAGDA